MSTNPNSVLQQNPKPTDPASGIAGPLWNNPLRDISKGMTGTAFYAVLVIGISVAAYVNGSKPAFGFIIGGVVILVLSMGIAKYAHVISLGAIVVAVLFFGHSLLVKDKGFIHTGNFSEIVSDLKHMVSKGKSNVEIGKTPAEGTKDAGTGQVGASNGA